MDFFETADFEAADFIVEDAAVGLPGRGTSSVQVLTRGESSVQ